MNIFVDHRTCRGNQARFRPSETQSKFAKRILLDWENARTKFWQVVPKEMLDKLAGSVQRKAEEAARA
ncbi:MAG: hypothetical protein WAN51_03640 [Alphaproteobacteria bacterium]